jgi:outer membrane protein OmpA-like peptidoglycan-associated protein
VLVSAANTSSTTTGEDGAFELRDVPAGLVVTTGSHPDYVSDSETSDLTAGETVEVRLELAQAKNESEQLAQRLEREGRVDLYGIYFDTAQATLKPESEQTLEQVRLLLAENPNLRLVIAGHTDNEGADEYNLGLSQRRAAAVVEWLAANGIEATRLSAEGLGETRPVADNASVEGRALNRRVELRPAD